MLSSTLFSKFPAVSYNGSIITNITVRLKFDQMVENNLMAFYPYTVQEGERADVVAYNYYGDANYAWLIYLANNIYDPLEDWHKTEDQFKRYLTNTYGSPAAAQEKVMFYRVEWVSDDSMITPSAYNALPSGNKKYWEPKFSSNRSITHYERAQVDWVVDTNRLVELQVESTSAITVGQTVYQLTSGVKSAKGEVSFIEPTAAGYKIHVKHIEGEFAANKTVYRDEASVGTVTLATILADSLQAAEAGYWAPVSAYDYEVELNEAKKHIRLIDASYIDTIERDIRLIVAT